MHKGDSLYGVALWHLRCTACEASSLSHILCSCVQLARVPAPAARFRSHEQAYSVTHVLKQAFAWG
jgi:hypothetical protein